MTTNRFAMSLLACFVPRVSGSSDSLHPPSSCSVLCWAGQVAWCSTCDCQVRAASIFRRSWQNVTFASQYLYHRAWRRPGIGEGNGGGGDRFACLSRSLRTRPCRAGHGAVSAQSGHPAGRATRLHPPRSGGCLTVRECAGPALLELDQTRLNILSRHFSRSCPVRGLFKKQMAPAARARLRTKTSGYAVINMIGGAHSSEPSSLCRSRPLMPGS
jgi:hypothetical protein